MEEDAETGAGMGSGRLLSERSVVLELLYFCLMALWCDSCSSRPDDEDALVTDDSLFSPLGVVCNQCSSTVVTTELCASILEPSCNESVRVSPAAS